MKTREEIGLELREYFKNQGIRQKDIANALGTSVQYVNGIFAGRTPIGKNQAENFVNHYGLSYEFLLKGIGPVVKEEGATASNTDEGIPLIPINAMAGALGEGVGSIMPYDCERYIVPAFKDADFLVRVQGDSMEPKYFPGDIVACKKVPLSNLWFQWGKVYVLDTIQGALIKRIRPSSQEGCIAIHSENALYPPFDLHTSEINGVAMVKGIIRVE